MSKLLIDQLIHSAVVKLTSHAPVAREKTVILWDVPYILWYSRRWICCWSNLGFRWYLHFYQTEITPRFLRLTPTIGAGRTLKLWTAVLSKANSGPAETKAACDGMPPFSAGVIPEHTAVGAHQALGQRWAFLLFGKRVSSRGMAVMGVNPASEGMDCQADSTLFLLL